MITIIATIRILSGREQEFIGIFTTRRKRVLAEEPMTLEYTLYRSESDPREFTVIERFTSMDGHQAHLAASTDHLPMMACFDGAAQAKTITAVVGAS